MEPHLNLLGKIVKTHGYNGTMVLVSDQTLDDDMERLEEIFAVIDGLPVPFPVEDLTLLTDTSAHLRLKFVGSQNEARELLGCEVFTTVALNDQEPEAEFETWMGCTVLDTRHGKVGVVKNMEDYNGNLVMQIVDGEKETLISLYPEMITRFDHHAKNIYITAPDGYF